MKRILFYILILTSYSLVAQPISYKKAKAYAKKFIAVENGQEEQLRTLKKKFVEQPYHIFNAEQEGFVIIGGTEKNPKLLGYADRGHLNAETLAPQLRALLNQIASKEELRANTFIYNPRILKAPLCKSLWGQDYPFNADCPRVDGRRSVTGCVATAQAQLMFYHQWPLVAQGEHSYSPPAIAKELSVNFAQSHYDWANMQADYRVVSGVNDNNGYNKTAIDAVAKLMYDVGVATEMKYGADGSSSYLNLAVYSLKHYFAYEAEILSRSAFQGSGFIDKIKAELDADRPVLFSATLDNSSSGHAWVIDGYDENGYFHCNWGWAGDGNGYFALDAMSPTSGGVFGRNFDGYNTNQSILIAKPLKDGATATLSKQAHLRFTNLGGLNYNIEGAWEQDIPVFIDFQRLTNDKPTAFSGRIAVGVYNAEGNLLAIKGKRDISILSELYESGKLHLDFASMQSGIYKLCLLYQEEGAKEWSKVASANTLVLELKDNKIYLKEDNGRIRLRFKSKPKQDVAIYNDAITKASLVIENLSTKYIELPLRLKFTNKQTKKSFQIFTNDVHLDALATNKVVIRYDLGELEERLPEGKYQLDYELVTEQLKYGRRTEVVTSLEGEGQGDEVYVYDGEKTPKVICERLSLWQGTTAVPNFRIQKGLGAMKLITLYQMAENDTEVKQEIYKGDIYFKLVNAETLREVSLGETPSLRHKGLRFQTELTVNFDELELEDGVWILDLSLKQGDRLIKIWNLATPHYSFFIGDIKDNNLDDKKTALDTIEQTSLKPYILDSRLYIQESAQGLMLYDLRGNLRFKLEHRFTSPIELDISSLEKGIYIIKLKTSKAWKTSLIKI